jgi:hypothetical protein
MALKASQAADKVAAQAAIAAELLVKSNAVVAETAKVTNVKLDVIHTLVNSSMTAAMQAELDATIRELAMMHEIVELKEAAGKKPLPVAERAITLTEGRIAELEHQLADRRVSAAKVVIQEKEAKSEGLPSKRGQD